MEFHIEAINGIDATRLIKKIQPDVKIVLITSVPRPSLVSASLRARAQSFLIKPLNDPEFPQKMLKVIERMLGKQES